VMIQKIFVCSMELGGCLGYSRRRKLKMSADYYEIQDQLGVEKRTVRALAFFWSLANVVYGTPDRDDRPECVPEAANDGGHSTGSSWSEHPRQSRRAYCLMVAYFFNSCVEANLNTTGIYNTIIP